MKDLIAKLQIDANCALGAIWMHIDAQAARIAELEAQIAGKPADTDKLREALQSIYSAIDSCVDLTPEVMHKAKAALDSTALQAPVREVPEQRHVYDWLHLVETKIGTPSAASAARILKEFYEGAEPDEQLPAAPVQEPKP